MNFLKTKYVNRQQNGITKKKRTSSKGRLNKIKSEWCFLLNPHTCILVNQISQIIKNIDVENNDKKAGKNNL